MSEYRTIKESSRLWLQIGKCRIPKENVKDLVYSFTNGRETSTTKLTSEECNAMMDHLWKMYEKMKHVEGLKANAEDDAKGQRMRRKIISICHEMDWRREGGKIDMYRINEFCMKRGFAKKRLNDYSSQELPKLVTQFEMLLKDYYAKK